MDYISSRITWQIIGLTIAGVCWLIAYLINNESSVEGKKSFIWGNFLSLITCAEVILITIWAIKYITNEYYEGISDYIFLLILDSILLSIAILNYKRYRVGAILISLITINPITWYICFAYYKKRWEEMRVLPKIENPIKNIRVIIAMKKKSLRPPQFLFGKWINERYTVNIDDSNVEIFEHKNGFIRFPNETREDINENIYAIVYKEIYSLTEVCVQFKKLDQEKVEFKSFRNGTVLEIDELLKKKE